VVHDPLDPGIDRFAQRRVLRFQVDEFHPLLSFMRGNPRLQRCA
jgi:hypothetical protein